MEYIIKIFFLFFILSTSNAGIIQTNNINTRELSFPELKYINKSVDPCENFYEFSCGNFGKYNPRPENQALWDVFKILQEQVNKIAIESLASPIRNYDPEAVKKAKDMYSACINPNTNADQSYQSLYDVIEEIGGWPLISHIPKFKNNRVKFSWDFIGEITAKYGLSFFFNFEIKPFVEDTNIHMLWITRDAIKLPSNAVTFIEDIPHDYIWNENLDLKVSNTKERNVYLQYLIDLSLKLVRADLRDFYKADIIKGSEEVFDVIKKIRNSDTYPFGENYPLMPGTLEDLQNWSDQFSANYKTRINWMSFFTRVYANTNAKITKDTKLYVPDSTALANILNLVENTSPEVLMNFIVARLLTYMSPDTNLELWQDYNNFYKTLNNYSSFSRDEYCMKKITNYPNIGLSLAVAHEYQNYRFDVRKILKPQEIIDDLLTAFFELLDEKDWLDESAIQWIQEKANAMLRLIAFPSFTYDPVQLDEYYKDLKICLHDHFGNSQNMRAFNFAKDIEIIDKQRDRNLWTRSPLEVNAYYNQLNNIIIFPAGIMNEPFFTIKSKLTDYSRIGALIGHEITHGFDDQGRNTDATGNYVRNPWNENVTQAFRDRTQCFVDQYSKYYIDEINVNVNGPKTKEENTADNGGIREAFRAFQKFKNRSELPEKSGDYTTDQLFFISYATMWCKIDTTYSLKTMHEKDKHAPNRFRVIGTLSNMEEFSKAFNCPVGSKMNPEKKCVLW